MICFKKHLDEKLKATDKMGTWVKDFQDSDAPQFKGKSKEKRRQMAVAAKLGAERDAGMREEVELDEAFGQGQQVNLKNVEASMRKALKDKGNYKDGKVLWNFIDADVYMDIKPGRGQSSSFYKLFDRAADKLSKEMNLSEETIDEVLDTPEKMDRYKAKAKYSRDRAANSAAAIALRSKNAPQREHPAKDLKTMAKRTAGLRMADKLATKRTFKALRKEEVELDEQTQFDLVEAYLLENNIDADALSIEQLDEIIGKVVGGAFKAAAKTAVGAGRLAKKAANKMSTAGRADAAEKRAAAAEKRNKDRKRIEKARQRLRAAQAAARS